MFLSKFWISGLKKCLGIPPLDISGCSCTLKHTQSEKGRVTSTIAQETAVSTIPQNPIPS